MQKLKACWTEAVLWGKLSLLWVGLMVGIGAGVGIAVGLLTVGYRLAVGVFA